MHVLENRVIDPASQPPPSLLVSKDYQQLLCGWRIACLEENGANIELFVRGIMDSN